MTSPSTDTVTGGVWPEARYPQAGSPDILVIVLDDVGFAHLGCYGSPISTPNIDHLAAQGVRYRNFHVTPLCSPTRACLLTGRNHHAVGMGLVPGSANGTASYLGEVTKSAGMLPEVLKQCGYATIGLGKWHLTPFEDCSEAGPQDQWPVARGFNQFYGFLGAETDQFHPDLICGNEFVEPAEPTGYHLSEDLATQAIRRVTNIKAADPARPYFLYLAFGAAHAPFQAPKEYIDRYSGKFDDGWDLARERVHARQLELGIVPAGTQLVPRNPGVRPWHELTSTEQMLFARQQEVFAGFLEHTDAQIGLVIEYLKKSGRYDDTLIILLSDNGASQEGGEIGRSELLWMSDVDTTVEELAEHAAGFGTEFHHAHYPIGWAQVGNTPLKRYKQNTHGGGVRTPLIVSWPKGIPDPGAVRTQYEHVSDVAPTVYDILGIDCPDVLNGIEQMPLHGKSFAATLADPHAPSARHTQYYEMMGHRALYQRGWKAVSFHVAGEPFEDDVWELYHTDVDFSEYDDVSAAHPEVLQDLVNKWYGAAREFGVLPQDDRFRMRRLQGVYRRRLRYPRVMTFDDGARVPANLAPGAPGLPKRVEVALDSCGRADAGVLVSLGGRFCGYTLFVKDQHLHFEYCHYLQRRYLRSAELPIANLRTCGFTISDLGDNVLDVQLTINGGPVAEPLRIKFIPLVAAHIEPFEVGRDSHTPVSVEYQSPFPFSGQISRVEVEVTEHWPAELIHDFSVDSTLICD